MNEKIYVPSTSEVITPNDLLSYDAIYCNGNILANDPEIEGAHIHSCCEVYVNISGNVSFVVENNLYPISSGDVLITRPNEVHHCICHEDCIHEHYCVWINAGGKLLSMLDCFFDRNNGESNLIVMSESDKKLLLEYLSKFCVEKGKVNRCDPEALSGFFGLLQLLEKYRKNTVPAKKLPDAFENILRYIDDHFDEGFSIGEIANEFFLSRSALCHMFKKYLSLSPSKYIEAKKLARSKQLLEEGESVQNVCYACGFSDCSYFVSVFKKYFKITPYKYGKQSRQ